MKEEYDIEVYATENGKEPFNLENAVENDL